MIIFHGSKVRVAEPRIIKGKYTKDFDTGFYCTSIRDQAVKWSTRFGDGIVNSYYISRDNFSNYRYKLFNGFSEEWLDFIVSCRSGVEPEYDIIEGPMADDKIFNYISDFINKSIDREQFWALMKYNYPTHQIVFRTERVLNELQFLNAEKERRHR